MTVEEVYAAIGKSTEDRCHAIMRLICDNRMQEASEHIQACFECDENTAIEVANMYKLKLWHN
ncbi:MAG: hypothetical protein NC427_14740 [Ruminococcus flavefaciens]|nr:hypothetical protein [Ruminococcus flavefaciens]